MNRNWIAPLCGVLFVVLVMVTAIVAGQGPDPSKNTAQEIAKHYTDHKDRDSVLSAVFAIAAVLLLFFAGWVRAVLRAAEGPGAMLSAVAFGALVVAAAGIGVSATVHLTLAMRADDLDPVALSAINAIDYDFFLPFIIGMAAFLLSTGISATRSGALPGWLGWSALVLGVLCFLGPAAFVGFLGGLLFILVLGVYGVIRGRQPAPATG